MLLPARRGVRKKQAAVPMPLWCTACEYENRGARDKIIPPGGTLIAIEREEEEGLEGKKGKAPVANGPWLRLWMSPDPLIALTITTDYMFLNPQFFLTRISKDGSIFIHELMFGHDEKVNPIGRLLEYISIRCVKCSKVGRQATVIRSIFIGGACDLC
jgi:hypothetical protein